MHPLYRHFDNLGKAGASMGECEKLLGGLPNLGKMSTVYQKYHHLLQLIETDAVITATYTKNYTSGEVKAFTDGAASILNFLKKCHEEVNKKNIAILQEEE